MATIKQKESISRRRAMRVHAGCEPPTITFSVPEDDPWWIINSRGERLAQSAADARRANTSVQRDPAGLSRCKHQRTAERTVDLRASRESTQAHGDFNAGRWLDEGDGVNSGGEAMASQMTIGLTEPPVPVDATSFATSVGSCSASSAVGRHRVHLEPTDARQEDSVMKLLHSVRTRGLPERTRHDRTLKTRTVPQERTSHDARFLP